MVVVPVPGQSISNQKIYINLTNSCHCQMSMRRQDVAIFPFAGGKRGPGAEAERSVAPRWGFGRS